MRGWRAWATWMLLAACAALCGASAAAPVDRSAPLLRSLPRVVLWAWQRPEDLRGLGSRAGVAYLAAAFHLSGASVHRAPRAQPLFVDPDTAIVAVARIETAHGRPLDLSDATRDDLAKSLAALTTRAGVRALQIDFDATRSERPLYQDLIRRVRRELAGTPLSITALTSWCMDDDWVDAASIDELVPMLFRLGVPGDASIKARGAAAAFQNPACAAAVGVSLDEPTPALASGRRVYVFNPIAWTPASAARAVDRFEAIR